MLRGLSFMRQEREDFAEEARAIALQYQTEMMNYL